MFARRGALPRVLQVVLSLHPGGTERLVVDLVRRLRSELPMAVCCLDEAGAWGEQLRAEGVAVEALNRTPGFHPLLGRALSRVIDAHGATVIHCHHYSPFVYSALARLWKPRVRLVFTEHGRLSDAAPSPRRRLANFLLSRAPSRVATVSADLRKHVVAEGFRDTGVSVVYNGIDIGPVPSPGNRRAVREALGVADETFVVGTIARLDPVKHLDMLIEAMSRLPVPALLIIVGDGSERERLERKADEMRVATRFLGHRDDARSLLAACDVYANSSIHEGISLTILEAMAAALPVVATAVGGTPEILDASCGMLVPPRDAGALASALGILAGDRAVREALGASARCVVESRFTIDRMVADYRAAYYRAA